MLRNLFKCIIHWLYECDFFIFCHESRGNNNRFISHDPLVIHAVKTSFFSYWKLIDSKITCHFRPTIILIHSASFENLQQWFSKLLWCFLSRAIKQTLCWLTETRNWGFCFRTFRLNSINSLYILPALRTHVSNGKKPSSVVIWYQDSPW